MRTLTGNGEGFLFVYSNNKTPFSFGVPEEGAEGDNFIPMYVPTNEPIQEGIIIQ